MSEQPGRIEGTFEVDANGGATYSIPLTLPPGTAGLQPRLSLVYDNHLTDFGFLGVGWRLQGLSSIARVPATMAQDGVVGRVELGPNDRFAFDGARLMAVSGTYGTAGAVYHTELQQWMKVVPNHGSTAGRSGPDSFTAYAKDRTIYQFGQTADSQLLANAMPGTPPNPTVRTWLVNRITDRNGNYIVFRYEHDPASNAIYPKTIEYTGNGTASAPARRVEFKYQEVAETSADAAPHAAGGYLSATRRLLESVSTFVENRPVLTYRLAYARDSVTRRSRITSITVADRDGHTLPPTTFEWLNGATALFAAVNTPASSPERRGNYIPMDVNGDGIIDIVHAATSRSRSELALTIHLGRGDGTFAPPIQVAPTGLPEGGELIPLDIDADGCTDLVYARGERDQMVLTVFHARENNGQWTLQQGPKDAGGPRGLSWPATLLATDFDGDGRIDLVHTSGERDKSVIRPLRSNGTSFEHTPADTTFTDLPWSSTAPMLAIDYDGDGKGDLVLCREERDRLRVRLLWSDGKRFVPKPADEPLGDIEFTPVLFSMDVNGDGKPDLVAARMVSGTLELRTCLSNGIGLEPPRLGRFPLQTDSMPRLLPARITGSALPDLVIQTLQRDFLKLVVLSSNGRQFEERADVAQPFPSRWGGAALLPVDVDGDGRTDLLAISPVAGDDVKLSFAAARVQGPPPDLVHRIRNGWGEQASIEYKPLTDPSVYKKGDVLPDGRRSEPRALLNRGISGSSFHAGTGAASPGATHSTMDVQYAKYVVSAYERVGAPDQRFRFERLYAGARVDLGGRGWLGFSTLQTTDRSRNTKSLTTYRQDFPFSALQSREERYRLSDGKLLEQISYDYRDQQRGTTHEPQLQVKKRALFGGTGTAPDVVESTEYKYDDYSNITLEAMSVSGAVSRPLYVHHQYGDIDPANWFLGLERETKQTADAAGTNVLVYRRYEYDARANRTVEQVQDSARDRWLTTRTEYDSYGNRSAVTNFSGARQTILYDPVHHTFVARSVQPPNEAGLVLATDVQHDPAFGVQTEESQAYRYDDLSGRAVLWRQTLDGFGRVVERLAPNPAGALVSIRKATFGRDAAGPFIENTAREEWDGAKPWNRERKYQSAMGGTFLTRTLGADGVRETLVERTFDSEGRTVAETLPHYADKPARTIRRTFDELGRLARMERPYGGGGSSIARTDFLGSVIEESTEAVGTSRARKTRREYGYFGTRREIVKRVDALGGTTVFDYDSLGRITSGTDPAGVVTAARYDFAGRQTLLEVRKGTQTQVRQSFDYDDAKRETVRTDGRGVATVIKRDFLDRIVSKSSAMDGVTTYTYDDPARKNTLSRLAAVRMPNGLHYRYDYHANGDRAELLVGLDGNSWSLRSSFTPSGRLDTITYPDGTRARNVYNTAGSLVSIQADDNTPYVTYGDFAAAGRPQLVSFRNGVKEQLPYNDAGQLASQIIVRPDGKELAKTSMRWNELDQLDRIDDELTPERTQVFSYDAVGRLTRATGDYAEPQEFAYDAAGNLTRKGGVQFEVHGHQVRSGARNNAPVFQAEYDGAGNIVSCERGGAGDRYQFDASSNLIAAKGATFAYDFQGERVAKRTAGGPSTLYIERHFEVTLFPNGSRQETAYIVGPNGLVASRTTRTGTPELTVAGVPDSGLYFFHTNHINSTTIQTDDRGSEVCRVSYLPFGEINKLTGRDIFRHKFSGNELDRETGLYYFRSRYYDPTIGRFISADDQLGDALDRHDTFNRYAYVLNNPVSEFDPEGHGIGTWVAVLMGAAFVAGLALSVLTAGAALPLLGATIAGAAAAGFMYSVQHQDNFNARDFAVEAGIGAAVGLTTGFVFGALTRAAGTAIQVGVEQAAKMSATHFAKVVGIEIVAGFAAGLVGSAAKQGYYNDGRVDAGDLFIAGGWSAAGGLASGVGMAATTRHLQKAVEAGYKIHVPQCLGQSEIAKRAVKGAISTVRPALGVPVKEGGPRLVDAAKGSRFEVTPMA